MDPNHLISLAIKICTCMQMAGVISLREAEQAVLKYGA